MKTYLSSFLLSIKTNKPLYQKSGIEYYSRALDQATDARTENQLLVSMGIVNGMASMNDYIHGLLEAGKKN